jgi:hypothetical protein
MQGSFDVELARIRQSRTSIVSVIKLRGIAAADPPMVQLPALRPQAHVDVAQPLVRPPGRMPAKETSEAA